MESTFNYDPPKSSLKTSWRYFREIFSADSWSGGWKSLTQAVETLPLWALITMAMLAAIVVFDSSLLIVPAAAGAGCLAVYCTVKRAVRDGIRQGRETA